MNDFIRIVAIPHNVYILEISIFFVQKCSLSDDYNCKLSSALWIIILNIYTIAKR